MMKWTTLEGIEYQFDAEKIIKEFEPIAKTKLSVSEASEGLSIWVAHKLDPYLDGWFVPKSGGMKYIVGYMFIMKKVEQLPYYDGYTMEDVYVNNKLYAVKISVYHKERKYPTVWQVEWDEFAAHDKNGKLTFMWQTKGRFMLRKCAVAIGHRIAFAGELHGLYLAEEFGTDEDTLPKQKTKDITPAVEINEKKDIASAKDDKKIAGEYSLAISKTSTKEELEALGQELKAKNLNISPEAMQAIKHVYKEKYYKLAEEEEKNKEPDPEVKETLEDYEQQELIQDLLNSYNPDNDQDIQEAVDKIQDKDTKKSLQKAFDRKKKSVKEGKKNE